MSIPGSASPLFLTSAAAPAEFKIDRSLRFNSADSSYLSFQPASAGNRKTWTLSFWVKLCGSSGHLISAGNDAFQIEMRSDGQYLIQNSGCFSNTYSTAVFRDYSAWQHFVIEHDASNTYCKIYINGSLQKTITASNADGAFNNNTAHNFNGRSTSLDSFTDFYLAEVNFIDGQALDPTDFGEYDEYNVWQPKKYTGTYKSFDNSQTWSDNITTTGNSGVWHSSYPATNAFNNNDSNYAHANANGSVAAVVTLTLNPAISCSSAVTFLGGVTSSGTGTIAINGGTATAFTTSATNPTAANTATASFTGDVSSIVITKTSTGANGLLVYGFEIDGKRLVDSGVSIASNSFHLKFADNSSNSALGTDSSGNGNTWTVNNLSVDKPGVTTTGNISLSSTNRSFYFKGTSGQSITVAAGNFIWDSSDGISWTYRGTSSTSVSLTAAYILISGTTGITFTNSSSASVKYWDLALSAGIPNGAGTTATFDLEAYGAEGIDSLIDTPTNYEADSGNNGGNYATLNPLDRQSTNGVLSNGNLDIKQTAAAWAMYRSTMFVSSGKWYWEVTIGNNQYTTIGICSDVYQMASGSNNWANASSEMFGYYPYDGNVYNGSNTISYATGDTSASGSIVGVALDMDNGTLTFYKDGTSLGQATSGLTGKNVSPTHWLYSQTGADSYNFGQRPFTYTQPTDHLPLVTTSFADPTIADGSTAFDTSIWSGNSTQDRKISTAFSPDFVWVKRRSASKPHILIDTIRGDDNYLHSSSTAANQVQANLLGLVSDGYELGTVESVNITGSTYVGWSWDAGTSNTSISAGSLNSSTYDQSQTWSSGMKTTSTANTSYSTTGRTTTFPDSLAATAPFDADLNNFLYSQTGVAGTWLYVEFGTALANVTSIIFSTEYSCPGGVIKLNGTDVAVDQSNLGGGFVEVSVTGTIPASLNEIAIQGNGGSARLKYLKINGKYLIDSGVTPANVPTIASTVRANPSAGFSIVSYTGNGTRGETVGHGLNAVPGFLIVKNRSTTVSSPAWGIKHSGLYFNSGYWMELETTDAAVAESASAGALFNATNPGPSVFTLGDRNTTNTNGDNYIAYCWTPVEGYSSFGKYEGNGSADGPMVFTGFRVAWLMTKRTDTPENWEIRDSTRNPHNRTNLTLFPHSGGAEDSGSVDFDFLSNGFKVRNTNGSTNANGGTYIYMALAEHPFKTARAR